LTHLVPGLDAARPTSVARLRDLLGCPHRFLLAHVLGFRPREPGADPHRIDPRSYGVLVHRIAEQFARDHGGEFGARRADLDRWLALADALAGRAFDELVARYPLAGREVIDAERRRVRRDVRRWIEHDWADGDPREFIAAERSFGAADEPLALPTAHGPLFVAGRIDRLDREGDVALVRDLKTGRPPREADRGDPDVARDLQLAVYVLVAEQLAPAWAIPADVAAAYVYLDRFAPRTERAFRADRDALRASGRRWLDLALGLVLDGAYAQTPVAADCQRCPFARVCGDQPRDDLRGATGSLAQYRELKA
jgi:ATP-dependent helicase/DNAse subunit B